MYQENRERLKNKAINLYLQGFENLGGVE